MSKCGVYFSYPSARAHVGQERRGLARGVAVDEHHLEAGRLEDGDAVESAGAAEGPTHDHVADAVEIDHRAREVPSPTDPYLVAAPSAAAPVSPM
jgi:hypothetical protein